MDDRKRIALIAHDNRKLDLLDWARFNRGTLERARALRHRHHRRAGGGRAGPARQRFLSGPLGGDQQVGAGIAEGRLDIVIFFWDPLEPQPHDVDVKALLRIAVVYDCPIACNRATADFLLSSPLLRRPYQRMVEPLEAAASRRPAPGPGRAPGGTLAPSMPAPRAAAAMPAISETTSSLARVVTSPSSRPSAMSRSRRRMILPERVFGRSSAETIGFGPRELADLGRRRARAARR